MTQGPKVQEALRAARTARRELDLGETGPLPDILVVVEEIARVPVAVLELPTGVAGAFGRRRDQPFIFLNGHEPLVRQRFTLAHEFGHYWLKHAPVVDTRESIFGGKSLDEIQARYFAGEFILPKPALERWLERHDPEGHLDLDVVVRLAAAFAVSAKTASVRLEVTGAIGSARARALDRQLRDGAHTQLHKRLGLGEVFDNLAQTQQDLPRFPALMHEYGFKALELGFVDPERLAEALGKNVEWVRQTAAELGIAEPEDEPDF